MKCLVRGWGRNSVGVSISHVGDLLVSGAYGFIEFPAEQMGE